MKYLNSIGETEANTLSAAEKDKTHLSPKGTKVFGKMVAELIAVKIPSLKGAFVMIS
jgi:lysophospholipase L1-like esterase